MEFLPVQLHSLWLDARELDHLAPLFGFVGDEPIEVGGRDDKRRAYQVGKLCLDFGIGKARVDFPVELVDDLGGRVPLSANTEPGAGLISGTKSPTVGMSGSASERVAVVTPSARSLPLLIQRGGSPNILRITLSASASKHRPWLSKIRCGCHEWIFLIAASAFCRWRSSGSHMPKKI